MKPVEQEINRRRTFAIISHPDAGKTTLTEKLLLFGGAIHVAGAIKAKKASRHATSDFMEIEKQRGISVATSVMGFDYNGIKINLLDTPGHEDFCEDTYRTLTAVDSALMVIDSTKGVEAQTYKLFEVCRLRNMPVITFMNKLDREGMAPIELLDEVENKLQLSVCPMSWPIGMGKSFKGVYNLVDKRLVLFRSHGKQDTADVVAIHDLNDPKLAQLIGEYEAEQLRQDVELVTGVYPPFDVQQYLDGHLTPVFFGSAVNNFGVKELLDCFVKMAPPPLPRQTESRLVAPMDSGFSGFVFKIHANMDPKHRDRIAFLRICSGVFSRSEKYVNTRTGKVLRFSNPTAFMAQEKSVVDVAYPGDIIGLHDTGQLHIADTVSDGEMVMFKGIPRFSPEIFKQVVNLEPLKSKQLEKGLAQLSEEGVAQLFVKAQDNQKLLGTVGPLQFEVIQYRLAHEYGAICRFDALPYIKACWLKSDSDSVLAVYIGKNKSRIAYDKEKRPVYLAETQWSLDREIQENPDIQFLQSSD